MASRLSALLSGGSEEGFDTYCSPCFDNGISKEAVRYCKDCCVNYCESCLKTHDKIPLLQGHQIVDKPRQGVRSARTALLIEQCVIHQGKLTDMFCTDHDTVCCAACIAINHRSCVKVDYLPDVAKGIKTSQEYGDVDNNLDEMLNKLNREKTKRLENLSSLEKEKKNANGEITRLEEELKKKITELAQQARTELLAKYNEGRKSIEGDISKIEGVITKVKSGKDKLKSGNDAQLFLNVKGGKMIIKDGQNVWSALSMTGNTKCLKFVPNKDLQELAQHLNLLGSICIKDEESEEGSAEVQEYTAKLLGKYEMNDTRCRDRISGVAVALYKKKKIQFVSVAETMTLTRSFSTDHNCYGMAFTEMTGELFACNYGNQVKVYDKIGNVLKSYVNDDKGKPLFSLSLSIALSADQNTLFITDRNKELIALDKSSSLRWTFSDQELTNAYGVCVLPGDVILVSGYNSNKVIQVDKHGNRIGTLLGAGDNLKNPRALAYHRNTNRLIVGQDSKVIYVYTLSPM